MTLYGRSFLTLLDYTPDEIRHLLDLAKRLKREKHLRIGHRHLMGRNIVLLFEKTSTRTRCAFEVAGRDLGMGVTFLDPVSSQMGKKESIEDTARVLGRMYDGIEYRGFSQNTVELLAKYSGVPVWNGLTDQFHPTQMLADLLTIEEQLGRLAGVKLTFMGCLLYTSEMALEAVRPGAVCEEVDKVARDFIEARYPGSFGHALGHGVGLDIHEQPRLGRGDETVLRPEMCIRDSPRSQLRWPRQQHLRGGGRRGGRRGDADPGGGLQRPEHLHARG